MADYKVKFEVFEGPLDLLLYLIKRDEVDIYQVNLTKLATEFIEYVDLMRQLDLEVAGEFLVMAATLMYIKSRELLPADQQVNGDTEAEETDDPRWELIRQLVAYKKFKDAAAQLQALEWRQEEVFARLPGTIELAPAQAPRAELSLFDLINAVNAVLKRVTTREDLRDIFEDRWTVSEKLDELAKRLRTQPSVKFTELFTDATTRSEVVVTFLAILELIRLKHAVAHQAEPFSEIEIQAGPALTAAACPAAMAVDPAAAIPTP